MIQARLSSPTSEEPIRVVRLELGARLPRAPARIAVASLVIGLCAELFLDGGLGIGFPLFASGSLGAVVAAGGREAWPRVRLNAWLVVPLLFFAAMVGIRSDGPLAVMDVTAVALLALLLAQAWGGAPALSGRIGELVTQPLRLLAGLPWLGQRTWRAVISRTGARERLGPGSRRIAAGLALALPVLLICGALLASADALFAELLRKAFSFSLLSVLRIVGVVMLSALLGAGWLSHALRRFTPPAEQRASSARFGLTEVLVVLVLVDLLFLAFAVVQVMAAIGGPAFVARRGLSWAQYARGGFFQLLFAALFVLALTVALTRARREGDGPIRLAATVLMALVIGVVLAALRRMVLYERAFGLTQLRLFVEVFLCVLGGILLWRAVTLWRLEQRFPEGVLALLILGLAALNTMNPDALIARRNLSRERGTRGLDLGYLLSLGDDATPALVAGAGLLSEDDRASLCDDFHRPGAAEHGWTGWTLDGALASAARSTLLASCPPTPAGRSR